MTTEEIKTALHIECRKHVPDCSSGEYVCPMYASKQCINNTLESELDEVELIEWYNICYPNTPIKSIGEQKEITEDATNTTEEVEDVVNHPSHYTHGGMECIDEMLLVFGTSAVKWFCLCNAWKYRKRAMWKNGQEDIAKSDWYIAKYKELQELEGA